VSAVCFATSTVAPADPRTQGFVISWPICLTATGGVAIYLHSLLWWTEPYDMVLFLRPWFDHLVRHGPVGAFAHPFSNYTPAYLYLLAIVSTLHESMDALYLIKLLSVAGTLFAAFAVADLIKACGGQPKWAMLLFILPSAVINSALLAQCDALWAGACVLAAASMIRGRTARALVWCGVALAFKAQSAFIAPFIIGALIGHRAPLWHWAIPPLTAAAIMVPAWLADWPAWHLAMIYPVQSAWFEIPGRLANPWMFGTVFAPQATMSYFWVGFAAVAAAFVALAALTSTSVRQPRAMALLALLSAIALPYLFPKMLERYFFLADVLALAIAIAWRDRTVIAIAVLVQLASLLSLVTYMYFYTEPWLTLVGAVLSTAALAMTFIAARRSGARWPSLSGFRGARRIASHA
jgi:Gpi18-like mannosyltransferase